MEGHVYIYGQIGSSENKKGVELQDVISQVEMNKRCDTIIFHINSNGGFVSVGNKIHDYISSIPNAITIAEEFCGSIATKIHLAVPLERRFIKEGTEYFIHNPLIENISGNSKELSEYAEELKKPQKELTETYIKATGIDKVAIELLMEQETSLTDEQVIQMNFASAIIPKEKLQAVALIDKEEIKNKNKMSEFKRKIASGVASMCKAMGVDLKEIIKDDNRNVKAMIFETENGTIETPYEDLLVGDPIMLNGEPAPVGEYVVNENLTIVVSEVGIVGELLETEGNEDSEEVQNLKTEIENLKNQLSEKDTELDGLKTSVQNLKAEQDYALEVIEKMKNIKSVHVPIVASRTIDSNRKGGKPIVSYKEAQERRKEYKK